MHQVRPFSEVNYFRGIALYFFVANEKLTFTLANLRIEIFSYTILAIEFDIQLRTHLSSFFAYFQPSMVCLVLESKDSDLKIYFKVFCLSVYLLTSWSHWRASELLPWTCSRFYISFSFFTDVIAPNEASLLFIRWLLIKFHAQFFSCSLVSFILNAKSSCSHLPILIFYFCSSQFNATQLLLFFSCRQLFLAVKIRIIL